MKYTTYFALACAWFGTLHPFCGRSFMTYRSQGFNLARNNSGWLDRCTENNASIAVEYTRSFDNQAINQYFFGCNDLIFSGSRVANRGQCDIMADYFGLPTDFKSSLSFSPQVQNVITDLDFYWLLGHEDCGFNLRVNAPVVWTKWALHPCERVIDPGTADYPAGYMSKDIIERAQLKKGALDVLSGGQIFGDLSLPLHYGRINRCNQTVTKIADILVALGYNYVVQAARNACC